MPGLDEDLEIRIIDGIVEYIDASGRMPTHDTVRYTRPVAVFPEDCPLLCVWLLNKGTAPRTTNYYDNVISIGLSYQVEAVERAETLKENPERSIELLRVMGILQKLMRTLGKDGDLGATCPEAYELYPADVDYTPPTSLETGLVEGYAMTIRVMTQEAG